MNICQPFAAVSQLPAALRLLYIHILFMLCVLLAQPIEFIHQQVKSGCVRAGESTQDGPSATKFNQVRPCKTLIEQVEARPSETAAKGTKV